MDRETASDILLRPLEPDDAAHIVRLLGKDREAVERTAAIPWPLVEEDSRDWIAAGRDKAANAFGVLRREDGLFLGSVGFDLDGGTAEVGYWIGRPYWNRGYATWAVELVLELVRRAGAGLAEGLVFADNAASARVLVKNAFSFVGEEEQYFPVRGGLRRVMRYERVL